MTIRANVENSDKPLVVDLDGTLILTDMLHESSLKLLRDHPLELFKLPLWLLQGKARLKKELAERVQFDPSLLPYNEVLIEWLQQEKTKGRSLILCTASDRSYALKIAQYLGLFQDVIATDGETNLAGKNKAEKLTARFGKAGFDYVGNSSADLPVWELASAAVVANASATLKAKAVKTSHVVKIIDGPPQGAKAWLKALRVHQWLKNVLLFMPIVAAHQMGVLASWESLFIAFLSFSLCASSVYLANDLLDLESDRLHPRKKKRPFAAGSLSAWKGVVAVPFLLCFSLLLGWQVGKGFLLWLAVYFVITCAYSMGLKRVILLDCLTLAALYTLRVIAGAAALEMQLSFWLLAFSVFLFLSLAFIKRYAELEVQLHAGKEKIHGRGYLTTDTSLIQGMGVGAGYLSVLVLALYLNSEAVLKLYQTPEMVWGSVLVLLYWVSHMWMQAHRGEMHDDPLVFAVKDRASVVAGMVFALTLALGTFDLW